MKTFLIRGVPNSVQMDGWWMSEPPRETKPKTGTKEQPFFPRIIVLLALVIAGDALTWQADAGLSLALFGLLILLALWLRNSRRGWGGLVVYVLHWSSNRRRFRLPSSASASCWAQAGSS